MRKVLLSLFTFSIFLSSCQMGDPPLFKLLNPNDTGVTFNNTIIENANYNILDIYYLYNGGGVSIGDFDQNGLQDLFFTGNMVENKLYLNQGDLRFEDVSQIAGVGALGKWSYGSSVIDINEDGLLDIYVCASISADPEQRKNLLFINQGLNEEGIPVFKDEAASYGLDIKNHSTHAAFFDYDQDGDLDVIVLANLKVQGIPTTYRPKINDGSSPLTDQLFRNNGDGTFTEVSTEAGVTSEGFALGLATSDINNDGTIDIYVGNDFLTNDLLYINKGGQFVEQIDSVIKHQSRFSMGNDIADINNDGLMDIITLDMQPESNLRKKTVIIPNGYIVYINDNKHGYTHQYARNMLQVNTGNMQFSEIGQMAGVHQTEWSWSPLFADFDNDGLKDLLVTNGFPKDINDLDFINFRLELGSFTGKENILKQIPSVKINNYAFRNNGDLTFEDLSETWGFTKPSFSNGAAFVDLDNDGDLDYVVNNINDPAFIYENTADQKAEKNHYLRIKLNGTKQNPSAFGTKVIIEYDNGKKQYQEQQIYRGYVSTVEDIVHFGLGKSNQVDELTIKWPDGKISMLKNVAANQLLEVNYADAKSITLNESPKVKPLLNSANEKHGIDFVHQEFDYIDYNLQRGIPHKFSQYGPGLSVGDVNGDGLDDFYVGGALRNNGAVFTQNTEGGFTQQSGGEAPNKFQEDMGSLLFDADGDGDNDLYVVSGSVETKTDGEFYKDRLYLNDGTGNFNLDESAIPAVQSSGSCVRGADFDSDGDIDLFVGGRVEVGAYPYTPKSFILQNNDGKFKDVTEEVGIDLSKAGMVTDAIWSDYDGDHDVDLIVVGEFMPVKIFNNKNGKLSLVETGINKSGMWNSIISTDFDKDGDPDYILGNLGRNNLYCASKDRPVSVVAGDFDDNGGVDAIMACYFKDENGGTTAFPVVSWQELSSMSPKFRKRFDTYQQYGVTSIDQLLTEEERKSATILQANHLETSYLENLGDGTFKMITLPIEAQTAPVNGILATDVNNDQHVDLLLIGNDYGNEVNTGQFDAMRGLVLLGNGGGDFQPLTTAESGFYVGGDAKALVKIYTSDGSSAFLASQNLGTLEVFDINTEHKIIDTKPDDCKALIEYENGKTEYLDITYGSGFLSQSSRKLSIPKGVKNLTIYNYAGAARNVTLD